ncbi:hypothetical protein WG922_06715 [Ramlibacter sp. AN1015]|uniref:hypothetical protein n=1 Tax=Ramlibacter sp. AN1015 TaxID=3133428 RepID=UPI0030BC57B5
MQSRAAAANAGWTFRSLKDRVVARLSRSQISRVEIQAQNNRIIGTKLAELEAGEPARSKALDFLVTGFRAGNTAVIKGLVDVLVRNNGACGNAELGKAVRTELVNAYRVSGTPRTAKDALAEECTNRVKQLLTPSSTEELVQSGAVMTKVVPQSKERAQALVQLALECHREETGTIGLGVDILGPDSLRKMELNFRNPWKGLSRALGPTGGVEDLLRTDRFMDQHEMRAICEMDRCPVVPNPGSITPNARASALANFSRQVGGAGPMSAVQAAQALGKPVTLMLNLRDNHWTAVIVFSPRKEAGTTTVPCVLFDSLKSDESTALVKRKLSEALADKQAVGAGAYKLALTVCGGHLQESGFDRLKKTMTRKELDGTSNACGTFAFKAARIVNERVAKATEVDDVVSALDDFSSTWRQTPAPARREEISALRAKMLIDRCTHSDEGDFMRVAADPDLRRQVGWSRVHSQARSVPETGAAPA